MSHEFVVVYESPERRSCQEMRLVLDSIGLPAHVSRHMRHWQLLVTANQHATAVAELSAYQQDEHDARVAAPEQRVALASGNVEAILVFAFVITTCSFASWYAPGGSVMADVGHVDAGLVQSGQWWRSLTALTLHLDWTHLLSNLVFGALFGFLAAKWLGGGVAWLLILLGGAAGNLVNAYFHAPSHLSLGASTAVFAALGIGVANALRPSLKIHTRAMRRWSPLIAGGLLLAMTGTGGERTDVGAHVAGFFAGLAGGWLSSYLPSRWLSNPSYQWSAGMVAVFAVALSWGIAWSISS